MPRKLETKYISHPYSKAVECNRPILKTYYTNQNYSQIYICFIYFVTGYTINFDYIHCYYEINHDY